MTTEQEILTAADDIIRNGLREELLRQGHHLTGALEDSIKGELNSIGGGYLLEGYSNSYGGILNAGTTADRIPYSGNTGAGGTSAYIQALKQYWVLRGLDEKDALRAAFATAQVQMKEGMSTRASSRFSDTGRRQGFIGTVADAIDKELDQVVLGGYDELVDQEFQQTKSETI